jgi:predicted N-acetyltransferase YhbS
MSISFTIRRATPEDAEVCGRICYEAFTTLAVHHNFTPNFPDVAVPTQRLSLMFSHPHFYCVVAEMNGTIVGSNCLDERAVIAGIGPITVDPKLQNQRVGRALMQAVLDRAEARQFVGVRLVQVAYHNRSLALYTNLGFQVREPLSTMLGPPINIPMPGYTVRRASTDDLPSCNRICRAVHGHDRSGELIDAMQQGTAFVAEQNARISAYASSMGITGHAVGENNEAVKALIGSADSFGGAGILVPSRNADLFRWCLEHKLRIVEQATLMSIGLYTEPAGSYLPSILF